jgi:hypothetical protein
VITKRRVPLLSLQFPDEIFEPVVAEGGAPFHAGLDHHVMHIHRRIEGRDGGGQDVKRLC